MSVFGAICKLFRPGLENYAYRPVVTLGYCEVCDHFKNVTPEGDGTCDLYNLHRPVSTSKKSVDDLKKEGHRTVIVLRCWHFERKTVN